MSEYIHTPNTINLQDVVKENYTLSSSQFMKLIMPNGNYKLVRDFLSRPLNRKDLGVEVGSMNYTEESPRYFIRTKALQEHTFLLDINKESVLPIKPSEFIQMNLKSGDLLISKDSNIGEIAILDKDYPGYMLSGAIYRLPVKNEWRYYLISFIKHPVFREQLDFMVPKGATIRHAKTKFLDCIIPLPNKNERDVVKYVSILTKAIIEKESTIRHRHENIKRLIEEELLENQKSNLFKYSFPTYNDITEYNRIDTNIYCENFKKEIFCIHNYKEGCQNVEQMGFKLSRGQNLQITNIGESIYAKKKYNNFYTLVLPKFLSKFGTINEVQYLGNKNTLKTLNKGDLIFGAEGFEKGRSIVIIEEQANAITNIHGITFQQDVHDLNKAIYVKCFLDYLREKGLIDKFAVGGNGGSLAQKYWHYIPFPIFPHKKQTAITSLYHNPIEYDVEKFTLDNFSELDTQFNKTAGIYELDKTAKVLKSILNKTIDDIINDRTINSYFK